MADINKWRPYVARWEGGKANVKNDHGGPTNQGITLDTWKLLAPELFRIEATQETLWAMTKEQWDAITRWFWDDIQGDKIASQAVADLIVDIRWHSGVGGICWIVQPCLNKITRANLTLDGNVGPKTLAAINSLPANELFVALNQERWDFLARFIKRSEGTAKPQKQFELGWHNRLCDMAKRYGYPNPVKTVY